MPATKATKAQALDREKARGLFRFAQLQGTGSHRLYRRKTTYLVYTVPQAGANEVCLGSITRVRGGFSAMPLGSEYFLNSLPNVYPTRTAAAIGLVIYLNRYRYGRDRLDRGGIKHWRTPR